MRNPDDLIALMSAVLVTSLYYVFWVVSATWTAIITDIIYNH